MEGLLERQKIENRLELSFEEKLDLSKKSGERCCHCGKKVYWGIPTNRATIEHFVPLSQGGTNRHINLIMLCEDCNFDKGEKILDPETYLKYLDEPYKSKLMDYFESYIHSFEFFKRRNVLALDTYDFEMTTEGYDRGYRSNMGVGIIRIPVKVNRVMAEDIDEVSEYFIKYLKNLGRLDSEETARHNIEFWFNFACMYYVRGSTGEIINLAVICLNKHPVSYSVDNKIAIDHSFNIFIFPRYNNFKGFNVSALLCSKLPEVIAKEQDLEFIPIRVLAIPDEKFIYKFGSYSDCSVFSVGCFKAMQFIKRMQYTVPMDEDQIEKANEKINDFISKFDVIEEEMDQYIESTGYDDVAWMKELVITPDSDSSDD